MSSPISSFIDLFVSQSSSNSAAFGVPAPKASYADTEAYPLHNLDTDVNKTVPENYQSGWAV